MHAPTVNHDHAVVIGASMAGLAIAKALVDTFERVTVIDRDDLPEAVEHRRGVPQGRHAHLMLTSGREALEELPRVRPHRPDAHLVDLRASLTVDHGLP